MLSTVLTSAPSSGVPLIATSAAILIGSMWEVGGYRFGQGVTSMEGVEPRDMTVRAPFEIGVLECGAVRSSDEDVNRRSLLVDG